MGLARLDQLEQDFPLDVTYKSFYLRPDMPPEGVVREQKEGEQPGSPLTGHLGEVAEESGLVMRRAPLTPNTRLAFEASEFAKDAGLFEPFHRECYRALWEDGANLGELSVLQQIGKQVGLDPAAMEERLGAGHYTSAAQTQYEEALSIGVRGIPSFIIGRYFFSGAQPYDLFKRVADMAQKEEAGEGEG